MAVETTKRVVLAGLGGVATALSPRPGVAKTCDAGASDAEIKLGWSAAGPPRPTSPTNYHAYRALRLAQRSDFRRLIQAVLLKWTWQLILTVDIDLDPIR
jgi:hypothetical protein